MCPTLRQNLAVDLFTLFPTGMALSISHSCLFTELLFHRKPVKTLPKFTWLPCNPQGPFFLWKDRSRPHFSAVAELGKAFTLPALGLLGSSVRSRYQVPLKASKCFPHSILVYTCVPVPPVCYLGTRSPRIRGSCGIDSSLLHHHAKAGPRFWVPIMASALPLFPKRPERAKRPEQYYEFRSFTLASSTLQREQDVLKGFTDSRMCPWDNS